MSDEHVAYRVGGIAAMFAALSWITWAVLNTLTHGQMEAAGPGISPRLITLGQLLIVSWNLCLIPTALLLWQWLRDQSPNLILMYTVFGLVSLVFWAYGAATRGITGALEITYLVLSGVWWLGIGFFLRRRRRGFGTFTIILGVLALFDGFVSFLEPVPLYLLAPAGLKLPLSTLWSVWVGVSFWKLASRFSPAQT